MPSGYHYFMSKIIHAEWRASFLFGRHPSAEFQTVLTASIRRIYPSPTTRLSKVSSHAKVGNKFSVAETLILELLATALTIFPSF